MSCQCLTCKLQITDENHEIREPVKSMYENASEYVATMPVFTSELWSSFVFLI